MKRKYPVWWFMLLAGVALILIGVYALFEPWNTFIYLIKYTGIALVASSALLILYATLSKSAPGEGKWLITESIIDLLFAVILIFNPFLTAIAFPLLIGWWIMLRGLTKLLLVVWVGRSLHARIVILIIGIMSVAFGLLIVIYPFQRSSGISTAMSAFSLVMGTMYVYDAIRFKNRQAVLLGVI
jgi:uncharacterized membrane protein HdeD (DUF308 family)